MCLSAPTLHLLPLGEPAACYIFNIVKWHFSSCPPKECKHSVAMCHVSRNHHTVSDTFLDFAWRHQHNLFGIAWQLLARFFWSKNEKLVIVWVSPPSAYPVIICWWYTPHCLAVGAAAGQSVSHLIIALKAQSSNIIALSVTDDWDLQRLWSALVSVHLTGHGRRLIKGLLNMAAQRHWLSSSTVYKHTSA